MSRTTTSIDQLGLAFGAILLVLIPIVVDRTLLEGVYRHVPVLGMWTNLRVVRFDEEFFFSFHASSIPQDSVKSKTFFRLF